MELNDYQLDAIDRLKNGSILCGGVGSGKSRTALTYYFMKECGGEVKINGKGKNNLMTHPRNLYIITTAKKRDSCEWLKELGPFSFNFDDDIFYKIDSWNNIKNYKDVFGAFFIFDEQRVVGRGTWVKAFLNITRKNKWILLSATPGDKWTDYIPVFVANGFYKNRTEFNIRHIIYKRFSKYPQIDRYINEDLLYEHKNDILVTMSDQRDTRRHNYDIHTEYNMDYYKKVFRERWNIYDNEPIRETGKLIYLLRRVVNSDGSRLGEVRNIIWDKERVIIFYNYEFEAVLLRSLCENLRVTYGEWSGHKHEEVPTGAKWVYLVQYTSGCEGWNCITCNTMIFYSQTYSYRQLEQASGRIDRMNTPYKDLYYYHLISSAPIDLAIKRALLEKKNFNERDFIKDG